MVVNMLRFCQQFATILSTNLQNTHILYRQEMNVHDYPAIQALQDVNLSDW